jgi:hypothetical protein
MNKSSLVQTLARYATAQDLRQDQIDEIDRQAVSGEEIDLPMPSKGRLFRLRHPGTAAADIFLRLNGRCWKALEAEAAANKTLPAGEQHYEAAIQYQDLLDGMLRRVLVHPPYGNTGPGAITLGDIQVQDLAYLIKWLGGEIVAHADGSADDLRPFPGRSGSAAGSGVDGAAQPLPAERPAGSPRDAGVSD